MAATSSTPTPHIDALHASLVQAFSQPQATSTNIGSLLTQLKIALAECGALMPSSTAGAPATSSTISPSALLKARDVLEMGAFHSIRTRNVEAFERYMAQLRPYYQDYSVLLEPSERRLPLIGLDLLRLLASNQIARFHTVLEGLVKESDRCGTDLLHDNKYISHPVKIETWLMEGRYSKVWSARSHVPMDEYAYFVDVLVDTIRNEIASCEEKAYHTLPLQDAGTLLFFSQREDILAFASQRGWTVDPRSGMITFGRSPSATTTLSSAPAPAVAALGSNLTCGSAVTAAARENQERVVELTLSYARELEMIV